MSILFLVVDKKEKEISKKTQESLNKILQTGDEVIFKNSDEYELLYKFKPSKVFDFVCLIPNNSEVNENFGTILEDYKETREEKICFLPLVVLTSSKTKGVLNTCVWNNNIAEEVGVLTNDLAKMQIDTTLFGSLIPFELFFNEENYNKELKHYQHFYFFNKITKDENNIVFGIPKVLLYTDIDLSFTEISNEEKIKFFNQAKSN